MEQKKALCIVLASGIFLLVVLGTALLLWSPNKRSSDDKFNYDLQSVEKTEKTQKVKKQKKNPQKTISNLEAGDNLPPSGSLDVENFNAENVDADNLTVIANGNTTIYGYAPIDENPVAEEEKPIENKINESNVTTIELETTQVKPQNSYTENRIYETAQAKQSEKAVKPVSPAKTESKPAVKTVEKAPAKTTTAAASSSKTTAKTETAKVPDRFWIQVVSYTSKNAAESARDILNENKIQCELFTFTDAKGKLYYRVRVGPYTTKAEAEYWQKRILEIPVFAKSGAYITNTSASK